MRLNSTPIGLFSPISYSLRTTVISLSRSCFAMKELTMRSASSDSAQRRFSVAYDWHNYGNMPIGARSDIEGVPIERLQAFYKTYYQPDKPILPGAGKADE